MERSGDKTLQGVHETTGCQRPIGGVLYAAYIQSVVLERTCDSTLEDCRLIQRGDWLKEEVNAMMSRSFIASIVH